MPKSDPGWPEIKDMQWDRMYVFQMTDEFFEEVEKMLTKWNSRLNKKEWKFFTVGNRKSDFLLHSHPHDDILQQLNDGLKISPLK